MGNGGLSNTIYMKDSNSDRRENIEGHSLDIFKDNLARDGRSSCRHSLTTALRVRVWNSAKPEERAASVNVSLRGIYFATKQPLCEGEIVEVLLKMPEEVSGEQSTEWRCTGHVVRVEPFDPAKGKLGVGVLFYCYEAARPEQPPLPLEVGASWRAIPQAARNR